MLVRLLDSILSVAFILLSMTGLFFRSFYRPRIPALSRRLVPGRKTLQTADSRTPFGTNFGRPHSTSALAAYEALIDSTCRTRQADRRS